MRTRVAVLIALMVAGMTAGPAGAYPKPGRTILVSPPEDVNGSPASGGSPDISGDGRFVVWTTTSPLIAGDTNGAADCYVRDLLTWSLIRASLADNESEPNAGCSRPAISADGRRVAFNSTASNLVAGDSNNVSDVFVRDLQAGTTVRASVGGANTQGDLASQTPSISDDGTKVGFISNATNLVAGDTNGYNDVFVRDLTAGTTERATLSSDQTEGVTALNNFELSGNGRYVVFVHRMPWSGDRSNFDDVFVRDLVTDRLELVSLGTDGSHPNGNSFYPSISDDGRYVAFGTFGTNLVGSDFNGAADVFVRDRHTGVTERASLLSSGGEVNHVVGVPIIAGDGRFVTGNHLPTNYGYQDTNGNTDVYVFDRETNAVELASGVPDGTSTGDVFSLDPAISDDGRRVVFRSDATNLVEPARTSPGIYVRELGPSLGVGSLHAVDGGDVVSVSGFARFTGTRIMTSGDSGLDGVAAAGAELTRASALYRPEESDVFLRLDLAPRTHAWAPLLGTTARKPGGLTYGVELALDGVRHRLLARQTAAPTGTTFTLERCATTCAKIADVQGGDVTVGDAVVFSVPVELLGGPGATVAFQQAWVAAGEVNTGALRVLDELGLPTATIPAVSLQLATAAAGTPGGEVAFGPASALDNGRFSEQIARGAGSRDVWARACLGQDCRLTKVALS